VNDAGVRRHDLEVAEALLAPAEEGVALAVAGELQVLVGQKGIGVAEVIDLHAVVDDQLGRQERVDARGVAFHPLHGVAHGGKVDDGGYAGEVLQQHASGHEGDFLARPGVRVPAGQSGDVLRADSQAVLGAQEVFQKHFQKKGSRAAGGIDARRRTGGICDTRGRRR
jgi:hypothetical protein